MRIRDYLGVIDGHVLECAGVLDELPMQVKARRGNPYSLHQSFEDLVDVLRRGLLFSG